MSKFCASCGKPLGGNAKFCAKCGAAVFSVDAEAGVASVDILPPKDALAAKVTESFKAKAKKEAKAYTGKIFPDAAPAYGAAGELVLPLELTPFSLAADGDGLFSVLKSGISGLLGGFKRTLGDKKRLALVIALSIIWLLVNVLAALDIFPLPVRLLSWLTAARGSLIGGAIGKGLVAAMLAQIIIDKDMSGALKSGLGQLGGMAKGGKEANGSLLLGLGIALIACNMMVSTNLQNTMVCIAGFALSAKALTQNGFLRRFIMGLLPKAEDASVTTFMGGWALGFVLFAAVSVLPGGRNGFLLGILLLIAGGVLMVVGRNKKEVTAK